MHSMMSCRRGRQRRHRWVAVLASLSIVAVAQIPAAGQSDLATSAEETLEQAWRRALEADAEYAASTAQSASARAGEQAAKSARWPTLSVSATYTQFADAPALSVTTPDFSFSSPRIFDNDDTVMGTAQLQWPVFTGGSISAGIRAATSGRLAAEANEQVAIASLKMTVAELYVDVWHARKMRVAAETAVEALAVHTDAVAAMVEAELRSRADLLASKVALSAARDRLIQAQHAQDLGQGAYNRRLGYPLDRVPALAEQLPPVRDLRGEPLDVLQSRAVARRAELAAMSAGRDGLAEQAKAENGKRLPQFALLAGYQHLETTILDRDEFSMIGIGMQWSLFDGGQARNKAAALRRASEATEWQRQSMESAIRLQVQQHWLAIDSADARAVVAREALAEADENLRLTRELYAVEMITNSQVLEAVALQQAASAQATRAAMDTVLARLTLLRSVGEL